MLKGSAKSRKDHVGEPKELERKGDETERRRKISRKKRK